MNSVADIGINTKRGRLLVGLLLVWSSSSIAASVNYTYDSLNRLTQSNYNNGELVIEYTYDLAGNMLQRRIGGEIPLLTVSVVAQ